jgi:hypothetical protein
VEETVRVCVDVTGTGDGAPKWQYGVCVATAPAEKQAIQRALNKAVQAKKEPAQDKRPLALEALPAITMQVRWDNTERLESLDVRADHVKPAPTVRYADDQRLFVYRKSKLHAGVVKGSSLGGSSAHTIVVDGESIITLDLNVANHAPALFADLDCMDHALQLYRIQLTDDHASIYDIFSGEELSTLTQTATLQYREKGRAQQLLAEDEDLDSKWHGDNEENVKFRAQRKASAMEREAAPKKPTDDDQLGVRVTNILTQMLGNPGLREVGFLTKTLLLILGPAASGKTTLLKTLIMTILEDFPDAVPILVPVIDLVDVVKKHPPGSVIVAYLRSKFKQHAHLLLQAMLQRRAVFLIDGIDESGSERDRVQQFVASELLEPGHNTIVTSRHGGFSDDAFQQCRVLELLPLTSAQQEEMISRRMPGDPKAVARLMGELKGGELAEIASNPLMLTMLVSVYIENDHKVVTNKSELYGKGLQTIVSRTDQVRRGLTPKEQAKVLGLLQRLAYESHTQKENRRIFTAANAEVWVSDGWSTTVIAAMKAGRLPILSSLGLNSQNEAEFRFTHLTYQVQRLTRALDPHLTCFVAAFFPAGIPGRARSRQALGRVRLRHGQGAGDLRRAIGGGRDGRQDGGCNEGHDRRTGVHRPALAGGAPDVRRPAHDRERHGASGDLRSRALWRTSGRAPHERGKARARHTCAQDVHRARVRRRRVPTGACEWMSVIRSCPVI